MADALTVIDVSSHTFHEPKKLINSLQDLQPFLNSKAHRLIVSFIQHLSKAVTPRGPDTRSTESCFADSADIVVSPPVAQIVELLATIQAIIDERSPELLRKYLPAHIVNAPPRESGVSALDELNVYLLGGFGSAQRLDYGTGHELSFFAFLCGIWVLGGFETGRDEFALVFKAFGAYLEIVRKLVVTYNLEPAGSHGVWGLDDHSFLPYIFGSAQLAATPEGSGPPAPGSIVEESTVARERKRNMYFGAIGFIRDVKTGPFWEHSPYLYDISGAIGGWKKINQGMMKMYAAEVLGKFPVVQHFPFGSIFSWDQAPGASLSSSSSGFDTAAPTSNSSTMPPPSTTPSKPQKCRVSLANPANRLPTPTIASLRGGPAVMSPPARPTVTPPSNIVLNPETTATVPVPGGFAPSIGGVAVTTAPWAKPPTGPSGFGKGSGGGSEAGMSPGGGGGGGGTGAGSPDSASIAESPVRRVRSGSVTIASTGSLAGGKVTEYTNNQETGKEEPRESL
ncbi:hypothetical protein DRE_03897 [Drechslerella stenobrocha 248]|uniref:Serine/threonine-protein phosphatase 2A activator n=1 Tax=Drechslerella stenobrocha 248 TaxID=1043628 RepID=W7ICM9_9PEZI|nr:hypothetical protein DRE_03897 [Drechslerella stenobrocha 248]